MDRWTSRDMATTLQSLIVSESALHGSAEPFREAPMNAQAQDR
jgi:hypothetical protein